MQKRVETILLAVAACAGLIFILASHPAPERSAEILAAPKAAAARQAKETTIRNLTRSPVSFWLSPSRGREPAAQRGTLAVGAIQRVRTAVPLEVRFNNGIEEQAFTLDPGKAYTFRYDENDRLQIFQGSHGRTDAADLAPFVPTPQKVVDRMLELAAVTDKDIVYDLGCGDGRIVITAARRYGARGVGIDIDEDLVRESKVNAFEQGVTSLVRFRAMDATRVDFSAATVVAIYLLPESNELLRPSFEKKLKPGARVVCHNYTVPGWEGDESVTSSLIDNDGQEHKIFVYEIGPRGKPQRRSRG